jgi:hypothetical protein
MVARGATGAVSSACVTASDERRWRKFLTDNGWSFPLADVTFAEFRGYRSGAVSPSVRGRTSTFEPPRPDYESEERERWAV